jgi:predicted nucleic acid-binding protein
VARRLFIDTSAFIALEEARDQNHAAAVAFARDIETGLFDELVSSSYVFDELMSWFSRETAKKVELGENLRSGPVRLEFVTEDIESDAWRLLRRHADHPYSLTVCTSFVLMDRLGIKEVFTFDRDFAGPGKYTLLP